MSFSIPFPPIPIGYSHSLPLVVAHQITQDWQTQRCTKQYCYKKINQIFKIYTCSVNASSVSWTCRVKPRLTAYDKLLCKNKGPLTVFDDQLPVGSKWENVEFSFSSISIKPFPFTSTFPRTSLAIPIPIGIPWDSWKFPIQTHL